MLKQGMRAINAGDMNDLINFILQDVSRLVAVFVHKESLVLFVGSKR